jgi:hypothetical protein
MAGRLFGGDVATNSFQAEVSTMNKFALLLVCVVSLSFAQQPDSHAAHCSSPPFSSFSSALDWSCCAQQ